MDYLLPEQREHWAADCAGPAPGERRVSEPLCVPGLILLRFVDRRDEEGNHSRDKDLPVGLWNNRGLSRLQLAGELEGVGTLEALPAIPSVTRSLSFCRRGLGHVIDMSMGAAVTQGGLLLQRARVVIIRASPCLLWSFGGAPSSSLRYERPANTPHVSHEVHETLPVRP